MNTRKSGANKKLKQRFQHVLQKAFRHKGGIEGKEFSLGWLATIKESSSEYIRKQGKQDTGQPQIEFCEYSIRMVMDIYNISMLY